jgi:hypothetical protein
MRSARWIILLAVVVAAAHGQAEPLPADLTRACANAPALKDSVDDVTRTWRARPADPAVLYQAARMFVLCGDRARAMAALKRMDGTGAGLHPRDRDGFSVLATRPDYRHLIARIRRKAPPRIVSRTAFTIGEAAEGITWSPRTRCFYFGFEGRPVEVCQGVTRDLLTRGEHGIKSISGMHVDASGERLRFIATDFSKPHPGTFFTLRLPGGELDSAVSLEGTNCLLQNDFVMVEQDAYITCSNSGSIVRVRDGQAEKFMEGVPDPNGIVHLPKFPDAIFVAGWYAIARIDLTTKRMQIVEAPAGTSAGCIDGMTVSGTTIYAIQNCVHESGRVLGLELNTDGTAIAKLSVLERYNPRFEGLTTCVLNPDGLYFAANTQFQRLRQGKKLDPLRIQRIATRDLH